MFSVRGLAPNTETSTGERDVSSDKKPQDALYDEQSRWNALVRRDRLAAGAFVYGVVTTGVYCLPDCPSRLPRRENVRYFAGCEEAERAGFRPCRRCNPSSPGKRDPRIDAIAEACRTIESADRMPTLKELADAVGMSRFHFHKMFKKMLGVTPAQFAREKRMERIRKQLREKATITDAVYGAGFASGSRFYENASGKLGMKPAQYRNGGENMLIRLAVAECYLGWVLVAATEKGICAIEIGDDPDTLRERLRQRFSRAEFLENDPGFAEIVNRVLALLESPGDELDLPLDIQGTAFQRRVWEALREIPAGSTVSYTELAHRIGRPEAVRAVATAVAANKIAVAVPCHRVVRLDGNLAGYRWGIERKKKILEQEQSGRDGGEG